jgi:hypothetical protein
MVNIDMPKIVPEEIADVIQLLSGDGFTQKSMAELTHTSISFVQKTLYKRGIRAYVKGERNSRFWSKVVIKTPEECWEWQASKNCHGYGRFNLEGRAHGARGAHVVAWMLTHGPVPDGLCVLHRCDNPGCVNPNHLFLGTHTDNMRDMVNKNRHRWRKSYGN